MSLSSGLTIDCSSQKCSGGVAKLYLANKDDVDSITYTTDDNSTATAITMVAAAVFYEFEFADFTAVFNEDAPAENCNYAITQTFDGIFPSHKQSVRDIIQQLQDGSCCGFVGIVETLSGVKWLWGDLDKRRIKLLNSPTTTGAAIADQNQVTFNFQCQTTKLAVEYSGAVPV